MFAKVLVADRGDIAVRVMRTLEELGIATVAVYSEADAAAPHVRRAGEAHCIGPAAPADSYLCAERILETAGRCGADAVHPGRGPLAESADFARACEDAGVAFIGPPAGAIEAAGSRTKARALMSAAGIPVLPGPAAPVHSLAEAADAARALGFPVALAPADGGSVRVVTSEQELEDAFARGGGERGAFVERHFHRARHVEVQVLADAHGNVVHLGERACSIRRERQTLVEESPAPGLDPALRERVAQIGVDAARAVGYRSAGTVEGLIADGEFYFVDLDARGLVAHSVNEMVTAMDIVREQVLVAAGQPLSFTQADVWIRGHAIECRINAEDAASGFTPAAGEITRYHEPLGHFVRVESGVEDGSTGAARLRPDDRQADRLGPQPRVGHAAHAARAGPVRDRGPQDAAPLPPRAPGHAAVGEPGHVPRRRCRPDLARHAHAGQQLNSTPGRSAAASMAGSSCRSARPQWRARRAAWCAGAGRSRRGRVAALQAAARAGVCASPPIAGP